MPCYGNTIVKIIQIRQSIKESINCTIVWAIGTYPIEQEDNDIELVMFVPINLNDRDPDSQAIFEKNKYYAISEKIVPENYRGVKRLKMTVATSTYININKEPNSNNCPLKISLVGVAQGEPQEVKNDENAIIKTLVNDYTNQEYNFTVHVTYPHLSSRFRHFKNSIRPKESMLFVVSEMEVIQDELYVYVRDINYINTHLAIKRQTSESSHSQLPMTSSKLTRSKLLATHRNIIEESEKVTEILNSTNSDNVSLSQSNMSESDHKPSK
ncbi:15989_t:CDS:2, partial [Cetraspora pellucida]